MLRNFLMTAIAGTFLIASTLTATAVPETAGEIFSPVVPVTTNVGGCTGVHFEQGRVLTAAHCFKKRLQKQEDLFVEIRGQRGTLQWIDRDMDVAEVRYLSGAVLPAEAKLNCSNVSVFDPVYSVGYPSDLGLVMTQGLVARMPAKTDRWENAFIHTAPTAPGNSGGPLFNAEGEIIGIVVGGYTGYGLNIAVPSLHICNRVYKEMS